MTEQDREAPGDEAVAPPAAAPAAAPPPATPPPATPPTVAWGAAPPPQHAPDVGQFDGGNPPFTVGALIAETFARYGADPIRLLVVSLGPAIFSSAITSIAPTSAAAINPSAIGLSFLLSLLSLVVTLVGTATLFALADGGRAIPLLAAFERGVARSGWLFLTLFALGFGGFLAVLAIAIPSVFLIATRTLAVVAFFVFLAGFLVFGWAIVRLTLVIPAVVVDNLNTTQALRRSWKITRRAGVWLRLLGSLFLVGLLVSPASILAGLLVFTDLPRPVLLIAESLVLAFLAPVSALLLYSAYRRLVPPPGGLDALPAAPWPAIAIEDPAAASGPALAPGAAPVAAAPLVPAPAGPRFNAPRLGTAGRAILVLAIVLGIGGIASVPYGMGRFLAGRLTVPGGGFPGFPNVPGFPGIPAAGAVPRGTVAFGTSSNLSNCTVQGQTTFLPAGGQGVWIAALTRQATLGDEVRLRIIVNGTQRSDELQNPGIFECLGTERLETGIAPGTYTFEVLLNGQIDSRGTLVVG